MMGSTDCVVCGVSERCIDRRRQYTLAHARFAGARGCGMSAGGAWGKKRGPKKSMFSESMRTTAAWVSFSEVMEWGMGKVLEESCGSGCRATVPPGDPGDPDCGDGLDACCHDWCWCGGCDGVIVSLSWFR